MAAKPAAGGGFWVEVAAERFTRWCSGFAQRHGGLAGAAFGGAEPVLELTAGDGATALCHVPFGPISADASGQAAVDAVAAHALVDRTVGVLLVRRGGYAAGLFSGTRLLDHKVGSRYVQGKTKAGGWSQQRYARRREGQAREAYAAAAAAAAKILLPVVDTLDAVVAGGDAAAVAVLRGEAGLAALWAKESGPFLNVGDPRLEDLRQCPQTFRAVRIRLVEGE
jgi:VLRF1 release factor-like protein